MFSLATFSSIAFKSLTDKPLILDNSSNKSLTVVLYFSCWPSLYAWLGVKSLNCLTAEQLLGLSESSDRGQPITYLLRHPQFVDYYESQNYLEPLVLPSHLDETRFLEYQLTLFGENDRLLLVRDCSKIKRLERMRQDFIANVSHELRTPLTVLSGYLETLSDYVHDLPAQWQRALVLMTQQTARMEHLVADLLTLSRLETSDFKAEVEPIHVAAVLEAIRVDAIALSEHQHDIILDVDAHLYLRGAAQELRSAFSNLVFNAVKYTPQGSCIRVQWYHDQDGDRKSVV